MASGPGPPQTGPVAGSVPDRGGTAGGDIACSPYSGMWPAQDVWSCPGRPPGVGETAGCGGDVGCGADALRPGNGGRRETGTSGGKPAVTGRTAAGGAVAGVPVNGGTATGESRREQRKERRPGRDDRKGRKPAARGRPGRPGGRPRGVWTGACVTGGHGQARPDRACPGPGFGRKRFPGASVVGASVVPGASVRAGELDGVRVSGPDHVRVWSGAVGTSSRRWRVPGRRGHTVQGHRRAQQAGRRGARAGPGEQGHPAGSRRGDSGQQAVRTSADQSGEGHGHAATERSRSTD